MPDVATADPEAGHQAAHTYAANGLRVIPVPHGSKHPPINAWQTAASTDPATIDAWWNGLYRGHGVSIVTGPGSGCWVLDVDVAAGKTGAASLQELVDSYGPLPDTVEAVTGSGGRHLFFAWDPAHPVRNNQSGKLGADLDVRGDGGHVVAAPTIHASGNAYRWADGRAPGQIELAPAPGWLHALLELDEPAPARAPAPPATSSASDSPAEWFNEHTTWPQLLERDGWTLATTLGSGEQRWTRPGKSARDGVSATVGHEGRDVLKVFTSSVPELAADQAYNRFGYEAAVRYHGDRSACARSVRALLMPRTEATDLAWADAPPALDGEAGDEDRTVHGWELSDLATVLDDDYEPPVPTVLTRTDGVGLFYAGRVNALWGESGSGKSWVALAACAQLIAAGETVLYVDHEATAAEITTRLHALDVPRHDIISRFRHVSPDYKWNETASLYLSHIIESDQITAAIIDSTGEAMAMDGAKPNDDDDVARWHRQLPRFLTRRGCTVILVDHIPKATDGPKLFAIGSQRKRAAISGAAHMVEARVSPAKGREGRLRLTAAKDRHGTYPQGTHVADLTVTSSPDGREVRITVAPADNGARPTVLMTRVSEYLIELGGWASGRQITSEVTGKAEHIRRAITALVDENYVEMEMRTGNRGGSFFRSVRPFSDLALGADPVDNDSARPRVPGASPARPPERGRASDFQARPRVPDPPTGVGRDAPERRPDASLDLTSVDNPPSLI